MAVQRESDADNLAVPASELQPVRTPADVGPQCHDVAIVPTRSPAPGVTGQEQAMLLHQPIDTFGIDGRTAAGSPLAAL